MQDRKKDRTTTNREKNCETAALTTTNMYINIEKCTGKAKRLALCYCIYKYNIMSKVGAQSALRVQHAVLWYMLAIMQHCTSVPHIHTRVRACR